jgi:hypothetical protein
LGSTYREDLAGHVEEENYHCIPSDGQETKFQHSGFTGPRGTAYIKYKNERTVRELTLEMTLKIVEFIHQVHRVTVSPVTLRHLLKC